MEVWLHAGEVRPPIGCSSDLPTLKRDKGMVALVRELISRTAS